MCTIAWENFERAVYITAWPSSSLQSAALLSKTIYAQPTLSNRGHLEAVSAPANSCTHIYPPAIYGGDWRGGGAGGAPVVRCDLMGCGQHRRQWGEGRKKCDGEVTTETVGWRVQVQDSNLEGTTCIQPVVNADPPGFSSGSQQLRECKNSALWQCLWRIFLSSMLVSVVLKVEG